MMISLSHAAKRPAAVAAFALAAALLWGGFGHAQSAGDPASVAVTAPPSGTGAPHYNLNLPVFASGTNDYDLSAATTTLNTAPSPASAPPAALPDGYTFDTFRQNIHGYVQAGVATHNGHDFAGGVEMPLVPGKVDLAFGANSGQIGGFAAYPSGTKPGTLTYNSYYASVHLHPADNFDAYIGVMGGHVGLPTVLVP